MTDTPRRIFGIICLLVAVWIVTYWLYQPSEPPVTFGERPAATVPLAEVTTEEPDHEPQPEQWPAVSELHGPPAPPPGVAEPEVAAAPVGPRLEPPTFREYIVQPGDTSMEVIARKELGDRKHWIAIAQANPFVDPAKLRPGHTRLKIPVDPANIQGRVIEPPSPAKPDAEPAPKPDKPAEPEGVVYTVGSGDTLSGIAKKLYGDPGLWRHIYEANRDVLKSPDDVSVGDKLKIPPKPTR